MPKGKDNLYLHLGWPTHSGLAWNFLFLALKIQCLRKFLGPGQIRMVGHPMRGLNTKVKWSWCFLLFYFIFFFSLHFALSTCVCVYEYKMKKPLENPVPYLYLLFISVALELIHLNVWNVEALKVLPWTFIIYGKLTNKHNSHPPNTHCLLPNPWDLWVCYLTWHRDLCRCDAK